jgi:DNA-binding transcriptional regulator YiaG
MKHKIRHLPSPLRKLRQRTGLSLREAGALIGRSYQTVWNWEVGAKPAPEADLERLKKKLHARLTASTRALR